MKIDAFSKLKSIAEGLNIPAYPDIYRGGQHEVWATYTLEDITADAVSDNLPRQFTDFVQLSIYMPINRNYLTTIIQVREAMMAVGFCGIETSTDIEEDQEIRRILFRAKISEEE